MGYVRTPIRPWLPPFANCGKGRGTHRVAAARAIKSCAHPPATESYAYGEAGLVSDQRLELVGGENSAERRLRIGRVSAESPTSRKEREKWGTRAPAHETNGSYNVPAR
jgi:hypothetical protein